MKTFAHISIILLLTALQLSCASYDMNMSEAAAGSEIIYNGFGEISRVGNDGSFDITRDDNALLRVVEYSGNQEIAVGKRVYFKYTILSENYTQYDIRIIVFNPIYSVPIVRRSFLLADDPFRNDSIGNDPIRVVTAAFSGKYINIGFEYFRHSENLDHVINLVWDDTRPATDSVYLELRHNAMGEHLSGMQQLVSETGLASFRIADLVPEGADSIDIKLKSNLDRKDGVGEYFATEKYYLGTYFPQ